VAVPPRAWLTSPPAIGAVVAALALACLVRPGGGPAAATAGARAPQPPPAVEVAIVGAQPAALAYGGGRLWVVAGGRAVRIDPVTLALTRSRFSGLCEDSQIAYGLGAVWATTGSCGPSGVYRIGPETLRVRPAVRLAGYCEGIAVWRGRIWVGALEVDWRWRLQALEPRAAGRLRLEPGALASPAGLGTLVAARGGLWSSSLSGLVVRVVGSPGSRVAAGPAGPASRLLLDPGGGLAAIAFAGDQLLVVVPGAAGREVHTVRLPFAITAAAVGGGYAWAAGGDPGRIARIGPFAAML